MLDIILALIAIGFGMVAVFAQPFLWRVVGSFRSLENPAQVQADWEKNLRFSGAVSLVLGLLLLAATLAS